MEDKDIEKRDAEGEPTEPAVKRWPVYAVVAAIVIAIVAIVVVLSTGDSSPVTGPTATTTPTYDVTVSIEAPDSVEEDSVFTVRLVISDVENIDSAQYDVTYDSLVLEVKEITQGMIDSVAIPVDMWAFSPAGVQGTARVINNVPDVPGVSGAGYMSEIQLHVVGTSGDSSGITFTGELLIYDNTATEIKANWVGDTVSVQ
jgi:hypothetical protein